MTNPYRVQNNMQTAVTVDGNVIEPRQLICHTEMIQSSFIYTSSVTVRFVSRHFPKTPITLTGRNLEQGQDPPLLMNKRRRRGGEERADRYADTSHPLGKFQSCQKLLEDKLLSLCMRTGRSRLSIHAWEFVKCPPLQPF